MGSSEKIKQILKDRGMKQEDYAKLLGRDVQQVRNFLYRDNQTYKTVESWLDAIDCEIVIRDKLTGKLYE